MKLIISGVVLSLATISSAANAALDEAVVNAVKSTIIADAGTAVQAGFAVMAVVLGASVGMTLLGKFINKGASGG